MSCSRYPRRRRRHRGMVVRVMKGSVVCGILRARTIIGVVLSERMMMMMVVMMVHHDVAFTYKLGMLYTQLDLFLFWVSGPSMSIDGIVLVVGVSICLGDEVVGQPHVQYRKIRFKFFNSFRHFGDMIFDYDVMSVVGLFVGANTKKYIVRGNNGIDVKWSRRPS